MGGKGQNTKAVAILPPMDSQKKVTGKTNGRQGSKHQSRRHPAPGQQPQEIRCSCFFLICFSQVLFS
jgi:hypothetical protein